MLTIYKCQVRDRYFVIDSHNHFEELEFPLSHKEWRQGWERLHEGEGQFIRVHPSYQSPVNPSLIFENWNSFPELYNKPVFVCHSMDEFGNDYNDIRQEMGV